MTSSRGEFLWCFVPTLVALFFSIRLHSLGDGLPLASEVFPTFVTKTELFGQRSFVGHVVYIASAFFGVSRLGMSSTVELEALTGPRDLALARKLVGKSGYGGEKAVVLSPTKIPEQQPMREVARDLFARLGLNVEYVSVDQGAREKRRLNCEPVDTGGWNVVAITFDSLSAADPSIHQALRGNGAKPSSAGPPASNRRICATSGS